MASILLSLGSTPPHIHKDLSHRADVLLHDYIVDGIVVCSKEACADLVSEDL